MKKRHQLPLLAKLDLSVDIDRLRKEFFEMGYDDYKLYDGLDYGKNQEDGLIVRRVLLEYFLNDEEIAEREGQLIAEGGDSYKMLCLTGFNGDPEKESKNLAEVVKKVEPHKLARYLERISDPKHPNYVPIADEKRYDKRNSYCKGYINEILDMVEKEIGHVCRTRFAVLKAGERIKPHMDINTDKAIRIHIPLITSKEITIGVKGKHKTVKEHMPADGSVWFLNQGYTHWVENNSDVDRIHLVLVVTGQGHVEEAPLAYWDE